MTAEEFIELSALLTGISQEYLRTRPKQKTAEGTDIELAQIYLNRVNALFTAELAALETAWQQARTTPDPAAKLRTRLVATDARNLRIAARQIIKVWYLSTIDVPGAANLAKPPKSRTQIGGDLGQFQQSVVWDVAKAHVPGYSNLQYGYWATKPGV